MPNLKDQVVLVTGANRGQGKDIAKHFASLGAKVAVGARRTGQQQSNRLCKRIIK